MTGHAITLERRIVALTIPCLATNVQAATLFDPVRIDVREGGMRRTRFSAGRAGAANDTLARPARNDPSRSPRER